MHYSLLFQAPNELYSLRMNEESNSESKLGTNPVLWKVMTRTGPQNAL
jgi:hypothetical protein